MQKEWMVCTTTPPLNSLSRAFISSHALRVNVMASTSCGRQPVDLTMCSMRFTCGDAHVEEALRSGEKPCDSRGKLERGVFAEECDWHSPS